MPIWPPHAHGTALGGVLIVDAPQVQALVNQRAQALSEVRQRHRLAAPPTALATDIPTARDTPHRGRPLRSHGRLPARRHESPGSPCPPTVHGRSCSRPAPACRRSSRRAATTGRSPEAGQVVSWAGAAAVAATRAGTAAASAVLTRSASHERQVWDGRCGRSELPCDLRGRLLDLVQRLRCQVGEEIIVGVGSRQSGQR